MAAPLFDDEWLTQSATEYDEAYASFQAAVTSSLSGTDEGIRQNMVFLKKVTKPLHDVCKDINSACGQEAKPNQQQLEGWRDKLKLASTALHQRMFVIMTAQSKGWAFARKLDFYQSGAKSDEHYNKVEKYFAKREDKLAESRLSSRGRGRGRGYHPYARPQSYGYGGPSTSAGTPRFGERPSYSQGNYGQGSYRPPLDKSGLKCHKCQETGHFIRDCPTNLGPKGQGVSPPVPFTMIDDLVPVCKSSQDYAKVRSVDDNIHGAHCSQGTVVVEPSFKPGRIHQCCPFWENVLQASKWVLDVLRDGYSIPFDSEPPRYREKNNASVLKNLATVQTIVQSMIDNDIVTVVSVPPHCINPLGLVSKQTSSGIKHRLIFDASRCVNLFVQPPSVKLSTLQKALDLTWPGSWQGVFDLTSAYYHVLIHKDHRKFLGASIQMPQGEIFFVYNVLPFGLNSAVHALTKLFKPIISYLAKQGISLTMYIDDGRLLSDSKAQCEHDLLFTYDILEKAGWFLEYKKSDTPDSVSQKKEYLGFEINTVTMTVTKSVSVLHELIDWASRQIERDTIEVKVLSRILGKIVSLIPSHGPLARICTRAGYVLVERHVDSNGWSGSLSMSTQCRAELRYFMSHCVVNNGFPVQNVLTDVRLDTFIPHPICQNQILHSIGRPITTLIASDASSYKLAVTILTGLGLEDETLTFNLSVSERLESSGFRELLSVHKALMHFKASNISNKNILWMTDSANVVSFLTKGSSRPQIQRMVFECVLLANSIRCLIEPVHLLREDPRIQVADALSKSRDTDNWSVDAATFNRFHRNFHFEIDLFADKLNRKTEKYVTKYFDPEAYAMDAFSIKWCNMAWVCPPVSLVPKVIRKVKSSPCQGLLIVPNWPGSTFYALIFDDIGNCKIPFRFIEEFNPYIIQNEEARNTPLFGKTTFSFFALYFDTTTQ